MILDTLDMLILSLTANNRFLKRSVLQRFGFSVEFETEISLLLSAGMLSQYGRKNEYIYFGTKTTERVRKYGIQAAGGKNYAYDDPKPARLARYAEIAMTCLRAGIDTASNSIDAMSGQSAFITSVPLRDGKEKHLVSCAQTAGFGRWQDNLYMFFYLTNDSYGFNLRYETSLLYSLSSFFGVPDTPGAFIFAGETYDDVYKILRRPQGQRTNGAVTYSKAFVETTLPIQLLSCDETGAMQLAITRQPDYKRRLLNATLGVDAWVPPKTDLDVDAMVNGIPLVFAVDMNIKRVIASIDAAQIRGYETVYVVALREQMECFWKKYLPTQGIELLVFPFEALTSEFGDILYTPPRKAATDLGGKHLLV